MVGRSERIFLVLVAVVIAGLVMIAALVGRGDRCQRWQARYDAARESLGGATGSLQFVNEGPMAQLEAARPAGCAIPS